MPGDVNPNYDSNALPNQFFRHQRDYRNEKDLYKSLLTEGYNKNGVPMEYYLVSYDTSFDPIFGEDNDRRLERKFDVMAYYELPEEEELYSRLGIEGLDNFVIWISKEHFKHVSTYGPDAFSVSGATSGEGSFAEILPCGGHIIKPKYTDIYFEIQELKMEDEMFHQEKHTHTLLLRRLKDEGLTIPPSLSGDDIVDAISGDDILDITDSIDLEKTDVLFNVSADDKLPDDPYGIW